MGFGGFEGFNPPQGCGDGGSGPPPTMFMVSISAVDMLVLELGDELINPDFNLNEVNPQGPIVLREVQDNDGNPAQDFLGAPNPVTMPFVYSKAAVNDSVQFTYTANDSNANANDSVTFQWQPRVYLGVEPVPGAINEAFIEALAENELRPNKGISRNGVTWTASEFIWVAFPQAFNPTDPLDFLITIGGSGFPGGFFLAQAGVSVTPNTPNGAPILYDVWRSTGAGSGLVVDVDVTP